MITHFKKYVSLLIIYLFNLFPIKSNKIMFFSYYGSQYGCNPKYITEYILQNYSEDTFDLVWAFNDIKSKEHLTGFRKVKTMSLKYFYELCTSKIIITNFRTTDLFVKRKKQYYIQTWHSSLRLKQIEKDAEKSLPAHYVQMAKRDSKKCDLLLSGCRYSTDIFRRSFWYDGKISEFGTPRNDVLLSKTQDRKEIKRKLRVPADHRIILYAPTFRKNTDDISLYKLDFQKIIECFQKKFGDNWHLLIRLHPHLMDKAGMLKGNSNKVIDVTTYDDIQELVSVSDALITDYSSVMFDFSIMKNPCFLYVPDLDDYVSNDRNLYFNLTELPFPYAKECNYLVEEIKNFNNEDYQRELEEFLSDVGSFETGNACENLLKQIKNICSGNKRSEVYETI